MTRFWNNQHHTLKIERLENQIILKSLGARKPKDLNRTTKPKVGKGHICPKDENISFNNNNIINEL
jgi:hypothetical protein